MVTGGGCSPEAAFELIASWRPDFALLDVMLPGMNGIEFAKTLKRTFPGCEIALVSGDPGTTDLLETARTEGEQFSIHPKAAPVTDLGSGCRAVGGSSGGVGNARGEGSDRGERLAPAVTAGVAIASEIATWGDGARTERGRNESAAGRDHLRGVLQAGVGDFCAG